MIKIFQGNILEADTEAIVNTINCVGIMGRGIALQFKKAYPENYRFYKTACENKQVRLGEMLVFDTGRLTPPRYIFNFPTKQHWKSKSKLEDIRTGLNALVYEVQKRKIQSIAIPPLGCGLGGLNWSNVKPLIEKALKPLPHLVVQLYEPSATPPKVTHSSEKPNMTIGRAILLGLMRKYGSVAMDWLSLLEIHKLMYLMQESGEPLRLQYEKGVYGPFAKNLRHVLNKMEGHYILGYTDVADDPGTQIQLLDDGKTSAEQLLNKHQASLKRFNAVVSLIQGFETSYAMELLATVHWVATKEGATTLDEVVEKTHGWNSRKRMFSRDEMAIAFNLLREKQWLNNPEHLHLLS